MSENVGPTHEQIQERAYQLFLERGGEHGGDVSDWYTAEKLLTEGGAQNPSAAEPDAQIRPEDHARAEEIHVPLKTKTASAGSSTAASTESPN
jgi:DUF2934 family protein